MWNRFYQITRSHINLSTQWESQNTLLALMETTFRFYKMSWIVCIKIFVKSLRKKLLEIALRLDWLLFCWKKLYIGFYHSIFIANYHFAKGVAKQPVNVIFAPDFLFKTITLEQELTRNSMSVKTHWTITYFQSDGSSKNKMSSVKSLLCGWWLRKKNDLMRTGNFGVMFFEVVNNLFGIYVIYLLTYLRVFFNLLKLIIQNWLLINIYPKIDVKKLFQKQKKELIIRSCLVILKQIGIKLIRCLNIILNVSGFAVSCYFKTRSKLSFFIVILFFNHYFEWLYLWAYFIIYISRIDYNKDSFEILNLKLIHSVVI